jgi:hypothetical protein
MLSIYELTLSIPYIYSDLSSDHNKDSSGPKTEMGFGEVQFR